MSAMPSLHRALAAGAAGLAVLAAWLGAPTPAGSGVNAARAAHAAPRTIGARQLAALLRDGGAPVQVIDLRGDSAFAARHVPSAEPASFARLDTLAKARETTVVVYSDDDVRDAQAWANLAARGHRRAYVLSGGMPAWEEEVMAPVLRGDSADYVAALSRYFGGAPRVDDGALDRSPPATTRDSVDRAIAADAFGDAERRGC
jgi:rhodanese-related sulfurtransferase